ncbi:MAG: type I-E CRISPR-associated endoribonuclease Cas2 [Ignavibacteriaceae bacterium]|nr:type I-E CRISPR-associated endoribonuclease Cas2 [Ignavibacteriaceae bacterium]
MLVIILESVPVSLRGELSRWLIEVKAGIFIGSVSALVRDQLWDLALSKIKEGGIWQIYTTNNEQGYTIRQQGNTGKIVEDFDGILLIKTLF